MNLDKVFKSNQKWIKKKLESDLNYFEELSKGQNPELLYIGCSDSRVTAEDLMGMGPGNVFVHRNIANLVPTSDLNVQSVIEFAVSYLKVKHIVVCGHYECGGVKAAMTDHDYGKLNPWINNIKKVQKENSKILNSIKDEKEKYNKLVELNVEQQCANLVKNNSVQKAIEKRKLKVHGWIFDIQSGKLIDLKLVF